MSLRTEIHAAIDEVAPPAPALPGDVMAFVFAAENRPAVPGRSHPSPTRFRGMLSMAAAILIVALMLGLVVGGRLLRDLQPTTNSNQAALQAEQKDLESRPLFLPPRLAAGAPCPVGPTTTGMVGAGPVYIEGGVGPSTRWGQYWYGNARVDSGLQGLVLIRGRDLRTGRTVIFVGQYAAGRVTGSDDVHGKVLDQHTEHVFDTGNPPPSTSGTVQNGVAGWDQTHWGFVFGLPAGSSSCIGWQVDGLGFTELFVSQFGTS
jgi:hypothetical protein